MLKCIVSAAFLFLAQTVHALQITVPVDCKMRFYGLKDTNCTTCGYWETNNRDENASVLLDIETGAVSLLDFIGHGVFARNASYVNFSGGNIDLGKLDTDGKLVKTAYGIYVTDISGTLTFNSFDSSYHQDGGRSITCEGQAKH